MDFYTSVVQWGNYLYIRGIDKGQRVRRKVEYRPYLFIESNDQPTGLTNLDGNAVSRVDFDTIREAKDFIERYKDVTNFRIFGTQNFASQWITDNFPGEIQWDASKVSVSTLDIEVACPNGFPDPERAEYPIQAITVKDSLTGIRHVWGMKDFTPHQEKIDYRRFDNESDMMTDFLYHWSNHCPDAITGWNVRFFDIPYVINRLRVLFGEEEGKRIANLLSPWQRVRQREIVLMKKRLTTYDISGVSILDYLEIYKKYTYTQRSSYKLEAIADEEELGENKIKFEGSYEELYTNNFQQYIEYNIQDVHIVDLLEQKLELLKLVMDVMFFVKLPEMTDTYGTTGPWEVLVYNHLWGKGIVANAPKRDGVKTQQFEGAYVKAPKIGRHKWVINFDFDSLYPNVAIQFNIGPETRLPYGQLPASLVGAGSPILKASLDELIAGTVDLSELTTLDVAMTGNRQFFSRKSKSFFAEIFYDLLNGRKVIKGKMIEKKKDKEKATTPEEKAALDKEIAALHTRQLALKIVANSGYGACGNAFFTYYSLEVAEGITISSKWVISWVEKRVNEYFNKLLGTTGVEYVVYLDTDSIYITLDALVKKTFPDETDTAKIISTIEKWSEKMIGPMINKACEEFFAYSNGLVNRMNMKRENIADVGIWTAKKRYILNVHDSEGVRYTEPVIKVTGLESVRSSTPKLMRERIKDTIKLIATMTEEDVRRYIKSVEEEFRTVDPELIARPVGIKELDDYVDANGKPKSGCPIHVRGALTYNRLIVEKGLENTLRPIVPGDKVRYLYLTVPNIAGTNVISFPEDLPAVLGLHDKVDRPLQFQKVYLEPIRTILDAIDWTVEERSTLEDLFG